MARKKKHPEHVNHERWLVSYADFITLLFAFFVVMFAVSQVDSAKMGRFVESVQDALNTKGVFPMSSSRPFSLADRGAGDAPVGSMMDGPMQQMIVRKLTGAAAAGGAGAGPGGGDEFAGLPPEIVALARDPSLATKVAVRVEARGAVVSLLEVGFFDSGSATIRPDGIELLDRVAVALRSGSTPLRFEGHADALALRGERWDSNWELSAARALSVLHHFERRLEFDGRRLSAGLYGEHAPLADNRTAAGRARNRRVDIVLLSEAAASLEPAPAAAGLGQPAAQTHEEAHEHEPAPDPHASAATAPLQETAVLHQSEPIEVAVNASAQHAEQPAAHAVHDAVAVSAASREPGTRAPGGRP